MRESKLKNQHLYLYLHLLSASGTFDLDDAGTSFFDPDDMAADRGSRKPMDADRVSVGSSTSRYEKANFEDRCAPREKFDEHPSDDTSVWSSVASGLDTLGEKKERKEGTLRRLSTGIRRRKSGGPPVATCSYPKDEGVNIGRQNYLFYTNKIPFQPDG